MREIHVPEDPSAEMTDCFLLRLESNKLAKDFLTWLIEHPEVEDLPGYGSSGMGVFTRFFPVVFKPQVEEAINELMSRYV